MYKIIKRNGSVVDFDLNKIVKAIEKAFISLGKEVQPDVLQWLAVKSVSEMEKSVKDDKVSVEEIQDAVEKVLSESGYFEVAKAYILYRKQHENIRETKNTLINYQKVVDNYLKIADWRVKENSTVSYSLGGLILGNSGAITANYWLSEVYDPEIAEAHRDVKMHIHDLSMLSGYCFTGDTRVKTIDGNNPTFEELVNSGCTDIWVYAYDLKNNKIVPAKAINPRVTREASELMEIVLCDGTIIRCTPDHLFLMRDGSYKPARELRANNSLMPLYIGEKSKYVSINNAWTSKKGYLHRWVAENMLGRPLSSDEVVHHKDGNKHNNTPENLEVISDSAHRRLEVKKTMQTDIWRAHNNARLVSFNKSQQKRAMVSERASKRERDKNGRFVMDFAYIAEKDVDGAAYNHQIRSAHLIQLEQPIKVYDLTVPGYENFAIGGNVFVHNCAGWNLKQLIELGITGVGGRISSKPASHLSTLCNQMVNFLGIMQNEWAGAQAFSSFDTYLAPFVKADNLSYKQVKQAIQSLVFGLNTPSRWGCSKITTKILTPSGWKGADELKIGDPIFTWVNGVMKEAKLRHIIRHKNDYGVLHQYKGRNYVQTVTPDHRCIVEIGTGRGIYAIKQSMDIFGKRKGLRMPANIEDVYLDDVDNSLTDEEVMLAAMYYADGTSNFDNGIEICKSPLRDDGLISKILDKLEITYTLQNYAKHSGVNLNRYCISQKHRQYIEGLIGHKSKIDERFLHLSAEQSRLFVETWAKFDGSVNDRIMCQYDNDAIGDALEIIMLRAGRIPHRWSRKKESDAKATNYIYMDTRTSVVISEEVEIPYDGEVWCPNTEDGTAIFKDEDGNIFISGNCQAPFTNVTIDWTVPDDLKDLPAIVGGKEMDFTYGDCQKEMDMINKAFIEVMVEGDANGRGFQYPIPTYSITKDFDWSETENNKLLFEMTAKYGIPYFSNYVNSDMEPSDIRSM